MPAGTYWNSNPSSGWGTWGTQSGSQPWMQANQQPPGMYPGSPSYGGGTQPNYASQVPWNSQAQLQSQAQSTINTPNTSANPSLLLGGSGGQASPTPGSSSGAWTPVTGQVSRVQAFQLFAPLGSDFITQMVNKSGYGSNYLPASAVAQLNNAMAQLQAKTATTQAPTPVQAPVQAPMPAIATSKAAVNPWNAPNASAFQNLFLGAPQTIAQGRYF